MAIRQWLNRIHLALSPLEYEDCLCLRIQLNNGSRWKGLALGSGQQHMPIGHYPPIARAKRRLPANRAVLGHAVGLCAKEDHGVANSRRRLLHTALRGSQARGA